MARRRRQSSLSYLLIELSDRIRARQPEFRQDNLGSNFLQKLYMTKQQRYRLMRWGSYVLACVLAVAIQDVILSRLHIFGATLDLPACVIFLITVIEGTESGSIFVLIASTLYYFSGSSPGPHVVAAMTILGIGATMFRQLYWHRSRSSLLLCGCLSLFLYEIVTFGAAIFSGLTHWGRLPRFLVTGFLSALLMIPLYPLIHKLGQIGGHTWKE